MGQSTSNQVGLTHMAIGIAAPCGVGAGAPPEDVKALVANTNVRVFKP
ncbi:MULTISPECIES: hypothetical protein [Cupriavidus]